MERSPLEITRARIGTELEIWFQNEACESLARETGFIQRSTSRLTGNAFFNLLTVGAIGEAAISYEGLCDVLEGYQSDLKMTPQALCERMNSEGATEFLKVGLEKTLQATSQEHLALMKSTWLEPFPRVLLQDSTSIELNEMLANDFKGCGGNASKAGIKIDYSYNVKSEKTEHIALRQGSDSDQGFANDLTERVQKNDLIIRDLGYFSLDFFAYLVAIGAFFLSRMGFNINVYLTAGAREPLSLLRHINRFGDGANTMEFKVFLGQKHRIPVRLIVYRLPRDVYRHRQKAAIKTAKRKGRGISLSYLKFLKFTFYITNVPETLWPMEALGTLYRLRWQVELTFKQWKSLFQIHVLKGTRPERIRCLIYGRLIVILVVQHLLARAAAAASSEQRELSYEKAIQWLLRGGRLAKAFMQWQIAGLLQLMLSRLKRLLKQKRRRLTTRQLIAQQVGYLDSFPNADKLVHGDMVLAGGS